MNNDDKDLKPMTIEEVYKKYNIDNSKKKSIYLWEFQVITQEFVSDMWEAIKHHATRATPQQPIDGNTSDGYHTFNELYDHRCLLWINYCLTNPDKVYLVENHFDGWFLLGKETAWGQISYHCPNKFFNLVEKFDRRHPKFDGHTSNDVINRLVDMAKSQQPSEPLKELDDYYKSEEVQSWMNAPMGKPSEKKALSREDIGDIISYNIVCSLEAKNRVVKLIFDALPAQREVRYPEYKDISNDRGHTYNEGKRTGFNTAIDEFKKLNGG